MTNFNTKQKLQFKGVPELYAFMDQQTNGDFEIYSKMYHSENPKWELLKVDGKSKVVKYVEKKERIEVVTMDNLNCTGIVGNFVYYECDLFKGKIKASLEKNENFISNLDNSNIDSFMWSALVKKSA